MALRVVVFDVGETLVDEAATYERWEAEGATTFVFGDPDLHADALPCLTALRGRGLRLGAAGNMHAHHEDFLRPYVEPADALVFSRSVYAPSWTDASRVVVIPPSIDPFSAKNARASWSL